MTRQRSLNSRLSASSDVVGSSPDIVVAGMRFSTGPDTHMVDGKPVAERAWHERLRGARELHLAVCEIYSSCRLEA